MFRTPVSFGERRWCALPLSPSDDILNVQAVRFGRKLDVRRRVVRYRRRDKFDHQPRRPPNTPEIIDRWISARPSGHRAWRAKRLSPTREQRGSLSADCTHAAVDSKVDASYMERKPICFGVILILPLSRERKTEGIIGEVFIGKDGIKTEGFKIRI